MKLAVCDDNKIFLEEMQKNGVGWSEELFEITPNTPIIFITGCCNFICDIALLTIIFSQAEKDEMSKILQQEKQKRFCINYSYRRYP